MKTIKDFILTSEQREDIQKMQRNAEVEFLTYDEFKETFEELISEAHDMKDDEHAKELEEDMHDTLSFMKNTGYNYVAIGELFFEDRVFIKGLK